ncbi:MAG: hypothetical protein IKK85_01640 [Clostridia bacterium]|nr:hypothetical protein [Clostridia bacterium]
MTDLFSILIPEFEKEDAHFGAISVDGSTYVIFALPYVQLQAVPDGYAFIDSYYIASNRAYFLRKRLCGILETAGFETHVCEHSYKHIAAATGLGVRLRSTLIANEDFGTRMALEIIGVKGVFAKEITASELYRDYPLSEKCRDCKICETLCPQGCIHENSFEYEKCTRHAQDNCFFSDEKSAKAAGTNLWGCDICQRFCPHNTHLPKRELNEEEKELFKLENLFNAFSFGKKGCEPYRDILGGNYLRPSRLLALTINVMANSKKPEQYLPYVLKAECHADERVKAAVERFKKEIKFKDEP